MVGGRVGVDKEVRGYGITHLMFTPITRCKFILIKNTPSWMLEDGEALFFSLGHFCRFLRGFPAGPSEYS